jgi:hypothetical protein
MYYGAAMPLNVRLSPRSERTLNALAKRRQTSRSDVVREAIEHYSVSEGGDVEGRPYDAWVDVIGSVALGVRDPGLTTGEQFTAMLAKPTRARRPR